MGIVKTGSGLCEGTEEKGLQVFYSVPYAKAERFKKPEPVQWDGIRSCREPGLCSVQELEDGADDRMGEDCQNMTILTPDPGGSYPVAVEIHGGAFQKGFGYRNTCRTVAEKGKNMVYITVQYRLGALGWLYLEDRLGEEYASTGNLGLLDQMAALDWIRENIAAFGGDPERITLIGNSAGGKCVSAMMLSPLSRDKFHQVILSSGGIQSVRTRSTASALTGRFLSLLPSGDARELLTMTAEEILHIQKEFCKGSGSTCLFGPVCDGRVIPSDWQEQIRSEDGWKGKAVIGSNRYENFSLTEKKSFPGNIDEILDGLFGTNQGYARKIFAEAEAEEQPLTEQSYLWARIISDFMYRTHADRLAAILSERGQKVWQYSLEFLPARHALDVHLMDGEYLVKYKDSSEEWKEKGARMREILLDWYIAFITAGDPGCPSLPEWRPSEKGNVYKMMLDLDSYLKEFRRPDALEEFPDYAITLD